MIYVDPSGHFEADVNLERYALENGIDLSEFYGGGMNGQNGAGNAANVDANNSVTNGMYNGSGSGQVGPNDTTSSYSPYSSPATGFIQHAITDKDGGMGYIKKKKELAKALHPELFTEAARRGPDFLLIDFSINYLTFNFTMDAYGSLRFAPGINYARTIPTWVSGTIQVGYLTDFDHIPTRKESSDALFTSGFSCSGTAGLWYGGSHSIFGNTPSVAFGIVSPQAGVSCVYGIESWTGHLPRAWRK